MSADPPSCLAPLQRVMLRDTLKRPEAGHHVERLEIVFAGRVSDERVLAAWRETVARTEALRMAFLIGEDGPCGWEMTDTPAFSGPTAPIPLEADRERPLLFPHRVPWRVSYRAEEKRFIWTFHHALLDGRSITRVLRNFLVRVDGGDGADLTISRWQPPSPASIARAVEIFAHRPSPGVGAPPSEAEQGPAVDSLGGDFANRLESLAAALEITAPTILTWAWGQALLAASSADSIWVEQIRAGAPQPGTAGFSMNLLPVLARRNDGDPGESLRSFRGQLLAMRAIESVSLSDLPPDGFPDASGPWASVIMIERGTLYQSVGAPDFVESLTLHERPGDSLLATAHILPDLRLEVEGPGRHGLLGAWIEVLQQMDRG